MSKHRWIVAGMAISFLAAPGRAGDDQKLLHHVLDQAIKALGGQANLNKYPAVTWKGKVTSHGAEAKAIATGDWYLQGPEQFRRDVDIEIDGQRIQTSMIINGKEGWV